MNNAINPQNTAAKLIGSVEYAGFWVRVLANVIDSVLVMIICALLVVAFMPALENPTEAALAGAMGTLNIASSLLTIIFVLLFWTWRGATPGKMAFGLVIVDATSLQKPSFGQYLLRYIGYIASTVVFCLGFIWVAIDARKQGWHDKIASTLVVKKSSLG